MKYLILSALIFAGCSKSLEATVIGKDGVDGTNGQSCVVSTAGVLSCGHSQYQLPNGLTILGKISPCGENEFANDEIFLRMSDGNILAVYDGGDGLSRLVYAAPGVYRTTDRIGTQCIINIDSRLNVTTSPTPATGYALNPIITQ